ncbi:biotin--[acetyl-CoA-carboxylase] ligase [Ruminiclostridium cellulolyticum]|uniref:Bifunctional ligase/repressor BirA n=1 Tax=Ruminiclostridium cellulolyticum (strain ATCC 35319 / DSM 5812 / JCM 6584 / H10) TaxID=394503 RepID=B8I4G8_RUMCH|nr:biotin--[acetyl-CoA-carboxylase] ligase [Ruminiclostridium cellulolyticum]ACL74522.1 biotin/acetyl-CoA-carboxylase ligase [Ruminiclostridium cellulolyticum H10]
MKNKILKILKEEDKYISGEDISKALNVSRTAVWKHINELRNDGYVIQSSSKKGYRFLKAPDILDKREINIPKGQFIGSNIRYFEEIDSTNSYAKKIANEGCAHGTVVISEVQTMGRGRVGRQWQSDTAEGIWFSIVVRPDLEPENIQVITLAASVAVVEAIKETCGIICGIKWPNDIILNGRKLGGILTELSAEPGHVNYVVVGIGLNANQDLEHFDYEIRQKAISLKMYAGKSISRANLLGSILTRFEKIYKSILLGENRDIIDKWTAYSVTIGKEVKVAYKDMEYFGKALSVASDGRLIVECKDGVTREISAGEIQVRGLLGYI